MAVNARNGNLVASFPVEQGDEIMLVTDGGQLIRCPVERHPRRRPRDAGRDRLRHRREGDAWSSVERISEPEGEEEASEAGD